MIKIDIAIPVFNEEIYLRECLDSIINFEIPQGVSTTIFIVDGGSTDQSLGIANEFQQKYSNIEIFHNQKKIQSVAMNLVINKGTGDYIMRLDAHSIFPVNYLKLCLETSLRKDADNVGGAAEVILIDKSYQAMVVQSIVTHKFGVGNAVRARVSREESIVDTVPFGFFKKSIFAKVGLFDERLVRCQDYEMNRRIKAFGGEVWCNPKINIKYYNQPNLIAFYKKQFLVEAPYNPYMWWLASYSFKIRHGITGLFTLGFLGGVALSSFSNVIFWTFMSIMILYSLLAFLSSIQQSIRYEKVSFSFILVVGFFLLHFLHGLGVLKGVLLLIIRKSPVQKIREPWPGALKYRISVD